MATRGDNGKLPPKREGMQNVLDALAVLGGGRPKTPDKPRKKEKADEGRPVIHQEWRPKAPKGAIAARARDCGPRRQARPTPVALMPTAAGAA